MPVKKHIITPSVEEILIKIGLEEEEAVVYNYLLQNPWKKATVIADDCSIKRGSIYNICDRLEKKGIIITKPDTKVKEYNVANPENLSSLIHNEESLLQIKKDSLSVNISLLHNLYNKNNGAPYMHYFPGINGIRTAFDIILKDKPKLIKECYVYLDNYDITDLFVNYYVPRRQKTHIKTLLLSYEDSKTDKKYDEKNNIIRKILPKNKIPFETFMFVYDDTLIHFNTNTFIGATYIKNSAITKNMHILFDLAWNSAK